MGVGAFARAGRRFGASRSGVTAVEFALIAPAFLWLIMGMAEITMIGFSQTSLDMALSNVARQIRTGEVQNDQVSEEAFHQMVCDRMGALVAIDCANDLYVDVDSYESFVSVQNPSPIVNGAIQTDQFGFDPGASSDVVLVRGFYRWHVITPLFQRFFANTAVSEGSARTERLLASTILLRNEPF